VKKADRGKRAPALTPRVKAVEPNLKTDPAFAIAAEILGVVPTSAWAFARIEHHDVLTALSGSRVDADMRSVLESEYRRQREAAAVGSRIAAKPGAFPGSTAGVCLIFADERTDYRVMMLLRDGTLPPFSSIELSILTFSLAAGTDRLAALHLQPAVEEPGSVPRSLVVSPPSPHEEAFYILDHDLEVVLAWSAERQRLLNSPNAPELLTERLPAVLKQSVRELTAAWSTSAVKEPGIARPVSFLVVRTQPLSGRGGNFVGVRVDRFRPPNSLTGAAARFHISPREVQVLALLLDGDHLDQIAHRLHITSSTVQDHIRSMLEKTESRNRSELIARILGWESSPNTSAGL
jgi:DNA-binding CsgD family transcriptional regulator